MLNIKKISSKDKNFSELINKYVTQRKESSSKIQNTVRNIISDVKLYGDDSLIKFSNEFDNFLVKNASEFEISKTQITQSLDTISKEEKEA